MQITLDGQPMLIDTTGILLMLIPGALFLLYLVFLAPKLLAFPQKYFEHKYHVKFVFGWRYYRIEGNVSRARKVWIELAYLFMMMFFAFGPLVLLALLTFYLQSFIYLMPVSLARLG